MNKKKLIARIGSVFACVLLLGALAVPCFAFVNPDNYDDAHISAISESFLSSYTADIGYAGSLLLSRTATPAEQRAFFSNVFLLCGYALNGDGSEIYNPIPPADLSIDGTQADYSLLERMTVSVVYGPYDDMQTKIYSDVLCRYMCSYSTQYGYTLELRLDYESGEDVIVYQTSDISRPLGSISLKTVVLDGVSIAPVSLNLAFLLPHSTSSDMLGALHCMFFGNNSETTLLFPNSYLEILAHSEYVTDNYEQGYNNGYGVGYRFGYLAGESSSDAYQNGYDQAVSEIDSGEFGANLLGATFNAPIRGLNQFVLVTTPNGVEITLGNVISAVIALVLVLAFLKVYAGG